MSVITEFVGKVTRCTYDGQNFKIYTVDVDRTKYPNVKHSLYKTVSIKGNIPALDCNVKYRIRAEEEHDTRYGYGYKVIHILKDLPKSRNETLAFLQGILTQKQAQTLLDAYPDIVDRVRNDDLDDIDIDTLNGINEQTFQSCVNKIKDNDYLQEFIITFQNYLSPYIIQKLCDEYTSMDIVKEKLSVAPYETLCTVSGIGFKKADSILLEIEQLSLNNVKNGKKSIINFTSDLRSSADRCLACVEYLLRENEKSGHTKANIVDLRKQCIELVPECINHFTEVLKAQTLHVDKDTLSIGLSKTYALEYEIAKTISQNSTMCHNKWEWDITKYQNVNNVTLSDEQMHTLSNVCNYNISILNGFAGCGKSFSTQAIINMLEDYHKSYKLMTPTGKSAKVLADFTNRTATTIHRGLGFSFELKYYDFKGDTVDGKHGEKYEYCSNFAFNKYDKLNVDMVIIDEFSMVDVWLFHKVLEAIDFSKTKLLLIGDDAQLPSVSCGNLLHDFIATKLIPTSTLTKVFRYDDGGLMKVATDVRNCKTFLTNAMEKQVTVFGDSKDYSFIDLQSEAIPKYVIALYKKLLQQGYTVYDIQVLTAKNVGDCGTVVLNNALQQIANPNYGQHKCMVHGNTTYYEQDLVLQRVNNYNAKVYYENNTTDKSNGETAFIANGETGVITHILNETIVIDFDGIQVEYNKDDMNTIGLGYAMTIHKSQGSSINVVILATPKSHTWMLNSNILYTGLTRMRQKCYHLGNVYTVNQATKKKANVERNTWMQLLLNEERSKNK